MEDGVHCGTLPAWIPALRARLQPLQPARFHPHDHRGGRIPPFFLSRKSDRLICYETLGFVMAVDFLIG